jgi:hypothetical protein
VVTTADELKSLPSNITRLSLSPTFDGDANLQRFKQLSHLEASTNLVGRFGSGGTPVLPALKSLHVRISDRTTADLSVIMLMYTPHLTSLSLDGYVTASRLSSIVDYGKQLRTLSLHQYFTIWDDYEIQVNETNTNDTNNGSSGGDSKSSTDKKTDSASSSGWLLPSLFQRMAHDMNHLTELSLSFTVTRYRDNQPYVFDHEVGIYEPLHYNALMDALPLLASSLRSFAWNCDEGNVA